MRQSARLRGKNIGGSIDMMLSRLRNLLVAVVLVGVAGCDAPVVTFPANRVHALAVQYSRDAPTGQAQQDVSHVLDELFGTPDLPIWPEPLVVAGLVLDQENLQRAAGPQLSQKDGTHLGLYREHCVNCHGLAGSGAGPASLFQNPYPRDFRWGVFKWKSTKRGAKPTREDLDRLLHRGIAGTGMPSFERVDPADLDALVDYLVYLSVRGQVERELLAIAMDDLGYGEDTIDPVARLSIDGETDGAVAVDSVLTEVASLWVSAMANGSDDVVVVPEFALLTGAALDESIQRGQEWFHGQIANCSSCHGKGGSGDATTLDYDDWTKAYSTRLGLTPGDRDAMRPFKKAGALTPRPTQPRRLTSGVFRGGGDPETLYRRITQGIAGTPMPSIRVVTEDDGTGLTQDQVYDLVRYVRSLYAHSSGSQDQS